jgi:hypothetical protein
MNSFFRKFRFLSTCFCLGLFISGCAEVTRSMKPEEIYGTARLDSISKDVTGNPKGAIDAYKNYLRDQQSFDLDLLYYKLKMNADLQGLAHGAEYYAVPVDGLPYFYFQHIRSLCRAYLGLGRAYLNAGDLKRADRAVSDAWDLARDRGDLITNAEVNRDATVLLMDLDKTPKKRLSEEWAKTQNKLALLALASKPLQDAYADQEKLKMEEQKRLADDNAFIAKLNEQANREMLSQLVEAAGNIQSINNIIDTAKLQNGAQLLSSLKDTLVQSMMADAAKKDGGDDSSISFIYALTNPSLLQQFSDPRSGSQPFNVLDAFTQQAKSMAGGGLGQSANNLTNATNVLQSAQQSGNPRRIQGAMEKFMPALNSFTSTLQQLDESDLKAKDAKDGETPVDSSEKQGNP